MPAPALDRLKRPVTFLLLVFFCYLTISLSPNGYNTIQAAPKTFFEGLIISFGLLCWLVFKKNSSLRFTYHDFLLLLSATAFFVMGALKHSNTLAAIIHPIFIFSTAFCGVIILRTISAECRERLLLIIAGAIYLCGIAWLISPTYTNSFVTIFSSLDNWGSESGDSLRYPLLVINPFGGFAQKNIFSVLLGTSTLILAFFFSRKDTNSSSKFIKTAGLIFCGFTSYIVGVAGSLTAALGLLVGSTLLITHFWKESKVIQLIAISLPIGLAIGIWDPFTTQNHINAVDKIIYPNSGTDCRLLWWQFNLNQLLAKPFFGHGLDSFSGAYMYHGFETPGVFDVCNLTPSHSHNAIAMFAAESGLFGLLSIVLPMILWIFIAAAGKNILAVIALLSPIGLHTQTEWPLNASMIAWVLVILIPLALSTSSTGNTTKSRVMKGFLGLCLFLTSAYLISTLAANRGVSIERHLIERSDDSRQIQVLVQSRYRLHPAFKPIYDIAINRRMMEIAIAKKDLRALMFAIDDYKRSIGPIAGHSDIQRLRRAELLISKTEPDT